MLIFSDLHLRAESATTCRTVLYDILYEAVAMGETTIGFLGDFYHLRYQVPVVLQNMVRSWLDQCVLKGRQVIFLPGNHDQVDEKGENALAVFHNPPQVRVYTEPTVDDWGCWLPYRKPEYVPAALEYFRQQSGHRPLFAHLPVRGAMMNNLKVDKHGIPIGVFKGFKQVILGHYHKQQTFLGGMAHYVGSPWQTRADEWGQAKGFVTWDGQSLTRHNRTWGRRYHRVEVTGAMPEGALLGDFAPQDHVRVRLSTITPEWEAWAEAHPVTVILEDASQEVVQPRFAFAEGTGLAEYVAKYMQDQGGDLDPNVLWAQWGELQ